MILSDKTMMGPSLITDFMILSVMEWAIQIVTDRIIKPWWTVYDPVYDPVRHGMSYPDSDGQDLKTMTDSL